MMSSLPALRGRAWLEISYQMFRAKPFVWLALLGVYFLISLFVSLVPVVGSALALVLKPVFTVGFLAAAWAQERGEGPSLAHLFRGFRANLLALLPLGIIYWAGLAIAVYASAWFDQGAIARALTEGNWNSLEAEGADAGALFVLALIAVPTIMALWFAPALVAFRDAGVFASLLGSFEAIRLNWRALTVFGLYMLLFSVAVPAFLLSLLSLLFQKSGVAVGMVALMPYWLALAVVFNISDYVSYRQIFHAHEN